MKINIKKLDEKAVIPIYASEGDAGMDLIAISADFSNEQYIEYGTGLAIEIPEGYVGLIFPRSSNSKKDLQLCNSVGIIDSGYRGEIKLRYRRIINPGDKRTFIVPATFGLNASDTTYKLMSDFAIYEIGDRVGQLMIIPYPKIHFNEVEELSKTNRGAGGFGSTGN